MSVLLELECPICEEVHYVFVPEDELEAYEAGGLAQDTLKSLNKTEREQIISFICPTCQDKIFK